MNYIPWKGQTSWRTTKQQREWTADWYVLKVPGTLKRDPQSKQEHLGGSAQPGPGEVRQGERRGVPLPEAGMD